MYNLALPADIVFGAGAVDELPKRLPADARILLVTGASARAGGLLERLLLLLRDFPVAIAGAVPAEPSIHTVDTLCAEGRAHEADAIVAVGGGSVIDAAKTAAALLPLEGTTADYFYGRRTIPGRGAWFAAVPTTAGTGAEITPNAVLIDPAAQLKQSIRSLYMFADLALIDPELVAGCPPQVIAASGMDALTQGIEAYISQRGNAFSQALALRAVKLILPSLHDAFATRNPKALSDVSEGCMLGAMAFTQSGLGAVHGLAHPIGSLLHLGHGETCAILLPVILRWNASEAQTQLDELAPDLISQVDRLRERLGLPATFAPAGLKPEHYDFILRNCRSGSMRSNPRDFTDAELRRILEELS